MQHLCCIHKPKVNLRVKCYSANVLPILTFGSEFWALNKKQANQLEVVHSDCQRQCLRQILGVRRCDRHRLTDIRARCGTVSLAMLLKAGRLRWLGHVLRMGVDRLPNQAHMSHLYGVAGLMLAGSSALPNIQHLWVYLPECMTLLVPALFAVHGVPCCTWLHIPAVRVFCSAGHMLHTSATPPT
jgi:hypothetical protein